MKMRRPVLLVGSLTQCVQYWIKNQGAHHETSSLLNVRGGIACKSPQEVLDRITFR